MLSRRRFLSGVAGASFGLAAPGAAAQSYPSRPVRIDRRLSPWRRGRHLRTPYRAMAVGPAWPAIRHREPAGCREQYRHRGGREGAAGRLHAPPCQHYERDQRDTLRQAQFHRRDIAPVAGIIRVPLVMVVNPSVPAKTVSEFIAYAKANPGRISMASAGNGSTAHVTGELFKMMTSVEMVHVPYRGSAPAVTDLLGGQVQVMFDPLSSSIEHIKAGKLRALAVTTRTRWETLPDIPTVDNFVTGFEASAFQTVDQRNAAQIGEIGVNAKLRRRSWDR